MTHKHHNKHKAPSRRPQYSPKQLLTSQQLNQDQAFHIASLQRALSTLAGWGVVYGFKIGHEHHESSEQKHIEHKQGAIYIGCGLAFDRHGRQLNWGGGWVSVNDMVGHPPDQVGEYTLCVHYAEKHIPGSQKSDECGGCENHEDNILWIDQSVVFTLRKGCIPKKHDCYSHREGCFDLNDYVCEQLTHEHCYKTPEPLCHIHSEHCKDRYYDPHHGIPLACVYIKDFSKDAEKCGSRFGFDKDRVSVCEYRPFVYNNHLLYELIRGDHLNYARVESLTWQDRILYSQEWAEQVPWDDFKELVSSEGFSITFSKPIQTRTLHPGSIILSALARERRTDYWESRRIPLQVVPENGGADTNTKVTLNFEDSWLRSEIEDERSTLEDGAIIELTIRGALIRDECGCMLDARPLGYENPDHPCCQSMPGGDFIAVFRVAPKEEGPAPGYGNRPVQSAE